MPSGEYINIQSGGILHLFQNEMGYSKTKCTETKKNRLNVQPDFLRASCRIRTNDPEITNHVLWPTELKRQRIYFNMLYFRASCRIRTNDPEITNHVLWPTELKRQGNIFQYVLFFEPLVGFEPTTPRLQITCSGQLS